MSDSIQDTEEWIKKEEIKRLAKLCLEEKWYKLNEHNAADWMSNCAFCEDALTRRGDHHYHCDICYITDYPICYFISEKGNSSEDKALVIKALEELASTGELSSETAMELIR